MSHRVASRQLFACLCRALPAAAFITLTPSPVDAAAPIADRAERTGSVPLDGPLYSRVPAQVPSREEPADLSPILRRALDRIGAPGAAAAVVRYGTVTAIGAAGVRSLGFPEPIQLSDAFPIGSCAKSITRLLAGRLADRGVISFDTTFKHAFPDLDMLPAYESVTLLQLLTHRGGIAPYTEIGPRITPEAFATEGSTAQRRAVFAAAVLRQEPVVPPGSAFEYSNAGYALAAHMMESKAGSTFEALVVEHVLAPLSISVSAYEAPPHSDRTAAPSAHERDDDSFVPLPKLTRRQPLASMAAAGGATVHVRDFARLAAALADLESPEPAGFLKPESARALKEVREGFASVGEPFFGGDGFFTAAFALWPDQHAAIVVATNAGDADDLCAAIIRDVRAAHASDLPLAVPAPVPGGGPRLGVNIRLTPDVMEILDVLPGSLAESSGLMPGDSIIAINATPMTDIPETKRMDKLREMPVTALTVRRDGKPVEISIRWPASPAPK